MDRHGWFRATVWAVEALPFALLCAAFRLLPVAVAARLGAASMAFVGVRIAAKHRHIRNNLRIVLTRASGRDVDEVELETTARDVWRNLGAVVAEYAHLKQIARERTSISIPPSVQALIDRHEPMIFLSGHLANWEILPIVLSERGIQMTVVYSPQANPLIERLIAAMRPRHQCEFIAKDDAAREMLRAAARRRSLGVLADLRVDSGPPLPFFGIATPTTTVPARLAQRRGWPLVGIHVERDAASRFRVVVEEPIHVIGDDDTAATDATIRYLEMLERWIVRHPGQWLCTKRRWPRPPRTRPTHATTPELAAQ
jgi:KDO2-lipid IV(A) lauroyltransferase